MIGQGACMGIEDAYVLCDCLCHITDKSEIPHALQNYYRRRIVRSAIVQGMSRLSSDIIINAFSVPFNYNEFRKEGMSYKYLRYPSLATSFLKNLLPTIFNIQFGYLYSLRPSEFTKKMISTLVSDSLARNKKEIEKVYNALKDNEITYFNAKTMSLMRYNKDTKEIMKISDAADFRE